MKILTVIGARPQFIKAAAVSKMFAKKGTLQKESFFLKKCCVIVRKDTEWTELTDAGYAQLAGYGLDSILAAVETGMNKKMSFAEKFYGDGKAANIIVHTLSE
jgi:UDP-GlcNAc3NAcA epimerase